LQKKYAWLLIDMGNTRLKWVDYSPRTRESSEMQAIAYGEQGSLQIFQQFLQGLQNSRQDHTTLQQIVLVHVLGKNFQEEVESYCEAQKITLFCVQSAQSSAYNIRLAYEHAEHYGADRFVGLLAAHRAYPQQWCLVVDCGTAITLDLIDPNGQHYGGLIVAGLSLCQQRLLEKAKGLAAMDHPIAAFSAQMPLESAEIFANNTQTGIIKGCLYSTIATIQHVYDRCFQAPLALSYDNFRAVICGGDAAYLQPLLQRPFVLRSHLLMDGLSIVAQQLSTKMDTDNVNNAK